MTSPIDTGRQENMFAMPVVEKMHALSSIAFLLVFFFFSHHYPSADRSLWLLLVPPGVKAGDSAFCSRAQLT